MRIPIPWLAALCLSSSLGLAAPQPPAPAPFDPGPALVKAARVLFKLSESATVTVTEVRHVDRYGDGFQYDTYETTDAAGKQLGRFTRVQVFPDATSQIDLAVLRQGNKLAAVEPVRPLILTGKPFRALPALFAPLKENEPADYAHGVAQFFHALTLLSGAAAGPPKPVSARAGANTTPLLEIRQPALELGDPIPAFDEKTLAAAVVSPAVFKGRRAAILVASMREGLSRDMLDWIGTAVAGHPELLLLTILTDSPEAIAENRRYLKSEDALSGLAIADPEQKLRRLFKCPILPYLHVFDKEGRLVYKTYWRGIESLQAELALAAKAGKR